jgi:hypothetical protein
MDSSPRCGHTGGTDTWFAPLVDRASRARPAAYDAPTDTVDRDTLLVSLSDKIHNARLILRDLRKSEIGKTVRGRIKSPKRETVWYHRELANVFRQRLPGQLANKLNEIVDVLESE